MCPKCPIRLGLLSVLGSVFPGEMFEMFHSEVQNNITISTLTAASIGNKVAWASMRIAGYWTRFLQTFKEC